MDMERIKKEIERRLGDFLGNKNAIVRISGGIDSAVIAYLCKNSIGKERTMRVMLPYKDQSTKDAELVINKTGIKRIKHNIKEEVDSIIKKLDVKEKVPKGNILARIRMTFLYSIANENKGFVIGTGNKSEIELGYFTKWGDGAADIEPIGDLYKTEIYKLAKELGVPKKIINKNPSAELWENQTDEKEIGLSYEKIDAILKGELKEGKNYKKIKKIQKNSEHKRKMPSIINIGK